MLLHRFLCGPEAYRRVALSLRLLTFFSAKKFFFWTEKRREGGQMGRGGGQVFSGPRPVQTPPEMITDIAHEDLDIRQLREDARLNDAVIGGSVVVLALVQAFEEGWRDRMDGEWRPREDRITVRCFNGIEGCGTSLTQLNRATAFHAWRSESPPGARSSVKEA